MKQAVGIMVQRISIFFYGYPGVRLPGGLCSKPQDKLPNLGQMHFNECIAFLELPLAGQLPELQVLHVKGADAIRDIATSALNSWEKVS